VRFFLIFSSLIPGNCLKLCPDHFLLRPVQFHNYPAIRRPVASSVSNSLSSP
jgi:hypothetical protein